MAKVVFMERSDGAFQKVMRTAETEIDSFGASGSGPMHEKLRAAYDSFLRGHPNLDPEQCFGLAWNGLSLSDQDQLRSEESGEYQERLAEEARYRESSMRAERRGEGKQTMKHEQVGILLKALHGVYADEDLTKSERGEVIAEVLGDYRARCGRDGLKDIAVVPIARPPAAVLKAGDCQELALAILQGKAAALRKAQPNLSESQAFSRVYTDPSNAEIAKIERSAASARFAEQAASSYTGDNMQADLAVAKRDNALDALKVKAAELRKANPSLSESQAFAKVYQDPANAKLAAAERSASRAALYA